MTAIGTKDRQGYQMIGGSLLVVVIGIALTMRSTTSTCTSAAARKSVMIFDQSEKVSLQTVDEILQRARSWVRDSVQVGELLSVYQVTGESDSSLRSVFSHCKPKRGTDANRWFENPSRIETRYQRLFASPLDSAINLQFPPSDRTPLAQSLIDISLTSQLRDASSASLLVFSDLLENDRGFSIYSCRSPQEVIPKFLATRTGMTGRPTFRNTRVKLHIIPRKGLTKLQVQCRDRLWTWFFGDSTGDLASLEVSYLPGI
jgi:hypothetical protein